ncbi:XRE family transcriptional regulator [Arthrobacter sp. AG367]|uniref:helix-turn-helix domain-containing protein n=1 Tax=Arthrobacter sp. AG367 TaxID=2572909 RepID=UPI0011A784F5|nr:cupin domain-containing protein [Arthrobacter sp. AG367]TWD47088.1 XRE family transcriptional regulator [Arthrobacter sp. AG367]
MSTEQSIGTRLRQARQARGVSLRSVAHDLGVSASLISQVETGKSKPSVATLYAFANLLGVSLDDVLGLDAGVLPGPQESALGKVPEVQRSAENPAIEMENGVRWERLAGGTGGPAESLLVTYAPGASSSPDGQLMRHPGVEYAYVLEGVITLQLEDGVYELGPGDSLQFDSMRSHMFANRGTAIARGIWFVVGRQSGGNLTAKDRSRAGLRSSPVDVLQRIDSMGHDDEI